MNTLTEIIVVILFAGTNIRCANFFVFKFYQTVNHLLLQHQEGQLLVCLRKG